jgi:hypothetical protein
MKGRVEGLRPPLAVLDQRTSMPHIYWALGVCPGVIPWLMHRLCG